MINFSATLVQDKDARAFLNIPISQVRHENGSLTLEEFKIFIWQPKICTVVGLCSLQWKDTNT